MEHVVVTLLSIITTLVAGQLGAIGVLYWQNRKQSEELGLLRLAEGVCREKLDTILLENAAVKVRLEAYEEKQAKLHQENKNLLTGIKYKVDKADSASHH